MEYIAFISPLTGAKILFHEEIKPSKREIEEMISNFREAAGIIAEHGSDRAAVGAMTYLVYLTSAIRLMEDLKEYCWD
jgi:hypothetical protein